MFTESRAAKPRRKLAVDGRMIANSGIGVYLANLLERLVAQGGFAITVLGRKEALAPFPWFAKVDFIPVKSAIYTLLEQWEIPRSIPACDLYWTPHFNVPALPIRAAKRVATIHDVYHLAFTETQSRFKRIYGRFMYGRAASASDAVITVSEFSAAEIRKHIRGRIAPIHVIPNGVADGFKRDRSAPSQGDGGRGEYILAVGNVKPHKNLRALIDAFSRIAGRFPEVRLLVVGRTGGMLTVESGLEEYASSVAPGRVVFTGHVEEAELRDLYAHARLFAFPSLYEGFGLPLLEAMSAGIPIVASDRGPMREVAGEAVRYFDPLDAGDMAASMAAALSERDGAPLGKYAERLAGFSWERSAARHAELFERITA